MQDDANDWPTFDVPADVPRDEPSAPGPAAGDPNAATPPADPAPPAAGGTPQAQPPATPPAPTGGAPASPEGGDVIPRHRLDETIADRDRYRTLVETQARQIDALLQRLGTGGTQPADPNAPPAPPPISPEDQRVRERLLQVIPELAKLPDLLEILSKKDDLLGVVGDAGRWRENEQAITDQFVQTSVDSVFDKVAAFTLGEGKTAKDLNPLVQQSVVAAFSRWVASDQARAARYERHDLSLTDEFWTAYKAAVYDPVRRDANAQLLERAGHPPALPQGGTTTPPAPPGPKPTDANDEDAVHASAWARRGEFAGTR